jgi:hypothetical protein
MVDTERAGADQAPSEVTLYRPAAQGGLEPVARDDADYRDRLRSRRWGAAPLENPEVERTDPRIAVAFVVALCVVTFVLLVTGYATGFWG